MNVAIIGSGAYADVRAHALAGLPGVTFMGVLNGDPLQAFPEQVDAAFVTAPTAEHFRLAEALMKQGVHVFLEWPPATSVRECQAIIELSEEAGVEVGVSRPLRFHPVLATLPPGWHASLIVLHREIPAAQEAAWPRWLADATDLCCALAQRSSVQRIDAESVRSADAWPTAAAFGIRFHSGTYAQVSIRRTSHMEGSALFAAGGDTHIDTDLVENAAAAKAYVSTAALIEAETSAFLRAVMDQHPVPVSILDGLHTLRLVERLMEKLR